MRVAPHTVGLECFAMGKQGPYFERKGEGSGFVISSVSFSDHLVRDVTTINALVVGRLTVSPDERLIAFTQIDHSGSDLFLLEDFR